MTRLIVLVVLVVIAIVIAMVLQRRRPDPPSAPSYRAPAQLDRNDFVRPDAPALIVVFASSTCNTCPEVWQLVESFEADELAVQRVDVQDGADLHARYRIDGVPTTVLADGRGVVVTTFFGPVSDEEFVEAVDALQRGEAPS